MERRTLLIVRALLFIVLLLAIAGTALELFLVGHDEEFEQSAPFYVLAAAGAALVVQPIFRADPVRRILQLAMLACIGCGVWGLILHYDSNVEFKREMEPDLEGWALMWETLHAKSPPSLAPGAMAFIGFLGLVYAFGRRAPPPPQEGQDS